MNVVMSEPKWVALLDSIRAKAGTSALMTVDSAKTTVDSISTMVLPTLTNPASAGDILSTKQAIDGNGNKITGTMTNKGAVYQTLNADSSYTIPKGYHNGSGVVVSNSLASQTEGTATESDIAEGLTAWVNGIELTGTAVAKKMTSGTLAVSSAITNSSSTWKTITHGLGEAPDIIVFGADLKQTSSFVTVSYVSWMGTYQPFAYHGTSTTSYSAAINAGTLIRNVGASTFQITSYTSSYSWKAGTYKWLAMKF